MVYKIKQKKHKKAMMKKVLIFIVALLALCSYGANAVENEEYEVIFVLHSRTGKYLVEDTLFGNNIIYTEKKSSQICRISYS